MGMWNWIKSLVSSEPEPEQERLEHLVDDLRLMAVGSYPNMTDEFLELRDVSPDKYDFFMLNAAVSMALHGVEPGCSEEEFDRVLRSAEDRLRVLYGEDAARAIVDCNEFVEQSLPGPSQIEDGEHGDALIAAVGMWIVWNLFGEKPGDDQLKLVSVLGRYAVSASSEYWQSP